MAIQQRILMGNDPGANQAGYIEPTPSQLTTRPFLPDQRRHLTELPVEILLMIWRLVTQEYWRDGKCAAVTPGGAVDVLFGDEFKMRSPLSPARADAHFFRFTLDQVFDTVFINISATSAHWEDFGLLQQIRLNAKKTQLNIDLGNVPATDAHFYPESADRFLAYALGVIPS